MDRLSRYQIILILSAVVVCLPSAALCQTKATSKTPPGTIAGRVTINGKGAPGIVVGVRAPEFSSQTQPSAKGTSDADGNYQIQGLAPGNYQVAPIAPAYVVEGPDAVPVRVRAKTILLAEGETVNNIDFSLTRGGVITGKVTDVDGRPVIEENVQVLFEDQAKRGQGFPMPVGNGFMTDDRGIYRIYGVPAGRYRIAVGQGEDNPYPGPRFGRVAYKRTYYPDATEASAGDVIEVTEGSEASNIDITVGRSLPSFNASGKVIDGETGKPAAGLWFGLRRQLQGGVGGMNTNSVSNSQGDFRIESVPPGKYSVVLLPREGTEVLADAVPIEIVDHDVTGLVVKTSPGLSITGSIVIENASDQPTYAKLLQQRLSAYVRGAQGGFGLGRQGTLNPDGSFRVGGLAPGTVNFNLSNDERRRFPLFSIVRVEHESAVQARGVEIKSGVSLTGVKLVVVYGSATVRGLIRFENGELPQNAHPTVWLRKAGDTGGSFRSGNLDARGRFVIEGIPNGSYELNVSVNIPGRHEPVAKQLVTVSEGTVTDVDITVDLKPPIVEKPSP